jgi:hypothetical protein
MTKVRDTEVSIQADELPPAEAAITPSSKPEVATATPASSATQRVQYRVRTRGGGHRS